MGQVVSRAQKNTIDNYSDEELYRAGAFDDDGRWLTITQICRRRTGVCIGWELWVQEGPTHNKVGRFPTLDKAADHLRQLVHNA